ncbi:MAG: ABC transporter ATP-binding protein [Oscillospiraceae bacterium]|nr:ABC transporter ATP-binding protein [Oscillospiraceae bacterium]
MIEVKHLVKDYGGHVAVSDLTFDVEDNQVYGFLGPNGAGKTTTMNIMTGYIGATSGDVIINGISVVDDPLEAKKQIGYLPELPPLYADMTAAEYLEFAAEIKGIKKSERAESIEKAMETTGVTDVKDRLLKNLSKGYRQRVGLAQAILGMPPVIILDEPTVGLDPKQIIEIRDLIRSLGREHTVILSSHILSEVSAVCDKVMIIANGKLVACDTPEKLELMLSGKGQLNVTALGKKADAEKALQALKNCTVRFSESPEKGAVRFTVEAANGADIRAAVFGAFADAGVPLLELRREHASLEEVFLDLTAQDEATEAQA